MSKSLIKFMKSKIFLFTLCLPFLVKCAEDESLESSEDAIKFIRGVEIVDNIDGDRYSMEFIYTDSVITSMNIVETNEVFATYEYDVNKRLVRSNCSCSGEKVYGYEENRISTVNDFSVTFSNDSIFVGGSFNALVKEGNVVENYFSSRSHSNIKVPESFKNYYAIREDEHFPLHLDKNLISGSKGTVVKNVWEYTFDMDGNVSSTRFMSYENDELLDDDSYNFIYE